MSTFSSGKRSKPGNIFNRTCILLICVLASAIAVLIVGVILNPQGNPITNLMLAISGQNSRNNVDEPEDPHEPYEPYQEPSEVTSDTSSDISSNVLSDVSSTLTSDASNAAPSTTSSMIVSDTTSDSFPSADDKYIPQTEEARLRVSDPDYYKDALFIGDSRTVGLYKYGKITGASFYACESSNAKSILSKNESSTGVKMSLTDYLKEHSFGKVYVLFGVNEVGNPVSGNVKNFINLINVIKQYQPNAIIVLQANMHVTKAFEEKSSSVKYGISNKNIDILNNAVAELSDNKTVFYGNLVNVFDDSNGYLNSSYTKDGCHLKSGSYSVWRDWLYDYGKR